MSKNLMFSLLGQGNVIPIHREVVRLVGSYECAALLEQIVYWMPRTSNSDMYVHKTRLEWMNELLLTEHQFKAARARLLTLKLLEEKTLRVERGNSYVNVPAYRLNLSRLQVLLEAEVVNSADSTPAPSPTRGGENRRLEVEVFLEAEVVNSADSIQRIQNLQTEPTDRTKEEDGAFERGALTAGADALPSTVEPLESSELATLETAAPDGVSADAPKAATLSPVQEKTPHSLESGEKTTSSKQKSSGGAGRAVDKSGDKPKKPSRAEVHAEIHALLAPESVTAFWAEWREHILERNPGLSARAARKQLECLGRWHREGRDLRRIVDYSIGNDYQGLFGDDARFSPARAAGHARASPGPDLDMSRYDLSQPASSAAPNLADEETPF